MFISVCVCVCEFICQSFCLRVLASVLCGSSSFCICVDMCRFYGGVCSLTLNVEIYCLSANVKVSMDKGQK